MKHKVSYSIYTVIVRSPSAPKWSDYSGHGCFVDTATNEAEVLKAQGVTVAIRKDNYSKKSVLIDTSFVRI